MNYPDTPSLAGDRVPSVTFYVRRDGDPAPLDTDDVFAGKRVIVFGLPGAFTPTCSSSHVPRYNELAPTFRKLGVDTVAVVSVNDGFVMDAWQRDQGADDVLFLPDGNGEFSAGLGMLVSKHGLGFGRRSWRYSMLVNDGVIEKVFIEPDEPGDPFQVSDADTMLNHLGGAPPSEITLFSKAGCRHCQRARALLTERGLSFEEIRLDHGVSFKTLRNVTGRTTTPQIYIDGEHIGGTEDLEQHLQ